MSRTLISIHDVMPETMDQVEGLLDRLAERDLLPTTLLVVPGRRWTDRQLRRLRAWQAEGHELAGHGWTHCAVADRTLGHRLHAAMISRDCAEHLSRARSELVALMVRNHGWFSDHGLRAPRLYVPPAWALGTLSVRDLQDTPFAMVESLRGVHLPGNGLFQPIPVAGFEADTSLRAAALQVANVLALARSGSHGWLRVALHPGDLRLRLARQVDRLLDRIRCPVSYGELFEASVPDPA